MTKAALVSQSSAIASELEKLDISETLLRSAVEMGVRTYRKATPFHPKTHGGSSAWGEVVAVVRQGLKAKGWSILDQSGLSMVCNMESGISIVISSGDRQTGLPDGIPSSRNSKGSATQGYVDLNYDLFSNSSDDSENPIDSTKTYVLLYYFDFEKQEVRYELSLPTEINARGYIKGWERRYLFGPISLKADVDVSENNEAEFNNDIDFDIFKKA